MPHGLQPTLYIPHGGGPCFFMDWDPPDTWRTMGTWLGRLSATFDEEPKAIVVISAHWQEDAFTITTSSQPELIYDYHGFPPETYKITYPARGEPAIAERIGALFAAAGIRYRYDDKRGFDHGVFIPFKLIYPDAHIPIIQVSLQEGLDPALHLAAGEALQSLRRENVLIVGSGMSYHNLAAFFGENLGKTLASENFDCWLSATLRVPAARDEALRDWTDAPGARLAHPEAEHLLPLMVAVGAGADAYGQKIFNDYIMGAAVSAFRFG